MGFQEPQPIAKVLLAIQKRELVLPAIQREFVWNQAQIARLFDSVLRGYPIGSFLTWRVEPGIASKFQFYGFIRDFHEKDHPYCPKEDIPAGQTVTAVLDGQQRLTALNIGLRGSDARRNKGGRYDNPKAFPKKHLHLNLLAEAPADNELGMKFDLQFLETPAVPSPDALWFPVSRLLDAKPMDLIKFLQGQQMANEEFAMETLLAAHEAINTRLSLNFYEEADQDVEKVLDIFIRVNSGGTTLSYSDLLLSIATAQWGDVDAREEVRNLVGELNSTGQGFRFSKDVVLKSGLVLTGVKDIGFKVRNFNRENMSRLQSNWEDISDALVLATNLLADFGLSDHRMTADSVIIPISYYLHRRQLDDHYRTSPKHAQDRAAMKNWVIRSLVKRGVWGSGLDTMLRELRRVIDLYGEAAFPAAELESAMASLGKSLIFQPEEIEDLLASKYGNSRTFAILALLFPYVDTRNVHHIDHVYPSALLSGRTLKTAGLTEDEVWEIRSMKDHLPNLQLLPGPENIAKSDQAPAEWAEAAYPSVEAMSTYLHVNVLPPLPAKPGDFVDWYSRRRDLLGQRLTALLTADGSV